MYIYIYICIYIYPSIYEQTISSLRDLYNYIELPMSREAKSGPSENSYATHLYATDRRANYPLYDSLQLI